MDDSFFKLYYWTRPTASVLKPLNYTLRTHSGSVAVVVSVEWFLIPGWVVIKMYRGNFKLENGLTSRNIVFLTQKQLEKCSKYNFKKIYYYWQHRTTSGIRFAKYESISQVMIFWNNRI